MTREQLLHRLSALVAGLTRSHSLRVAIDGIDAAGKSTLADELAPLIEARGRPVIRASVDGFHHPRSVRYRCGPDSPRGYYEDSFDYVALRSALLDPLGPYGNRRYRRAVFDVRSDTPLSLVTEEASASAILLFDGVFLLRPELAYQWDYRILVSVTKEIALQRAVRRDLPLFGSPEAIQARYERRYFPGQELYYRLARPQEQADVIVDNNDPTNPALMFLSGEQ
jgi:uridine kinase